VSSPDFSPQLLQAIAALAEEVWILRDRQRVLEAVLASHDLDLREEIDRFTPDAAMSAALDAERRAFIRKVMQPFGESRLAPNPP
jgi:hypothetical protein